MFVADFFDGVEENLGIRVALTKLNCRPLQVVELPKTFRMVYNISESRSLRFLDFSAVTAHVMRSW